MTLIGFDNWPIAAIVALFIGAALVITAAGIRLTRLADRLADETGLGEALFGAVLLGGTTSLPGIVTSVTAAAEGYAELRLATPSGGLRRKRCFCHWQISPTNAPISNMLLHRQRISRKGRC